MEMRQLRYFVAVVDAGSITKAAQQLHVVQSALSHQVANLEKELGVALLLRGRGGVVVTEAGVLMYRHAQATLKNMEAVKQSIGTIGREVRGVVSIGIPNSTVPMLAIPLLQAVRRQLPLVEISIFEGLSAMHAEMLAAGKLDLAVLFETVAPRGFAITPLFSETLHFVSADARACMAYAGLSAVSLREVTKWPLLLPPSPNGIRVILERECMRANLKLQVAANLSGVQTITDAVRLGLGSTVMMAANAEPSEHGKMLMLPIHKPDIERPAGLFQLENLPLTQAAESVKTLTIAAVRESIGNSRWPGAKLTLRDQT